MGIYQSHMGGLSAVQYFQAPKILFLLLFLEKFYRTMNG